jgi:predicted transposase YbfD/YdcC
LDCHFLVQVKGNCNKLFAQIKLFTALCRPFSVCETIEKGHGRLEHRRVELFFNQVDLPQGWAGIQRIVRVKRWGQRKGKPFEHTAYYILSKPIDSAHVVAKGIRGHWGIENRLHWTKDVLIGEDDMTITNTNAATVVAFLNTTALNLLQLAGYKPIKDTFAKFANKVNELYNLFAF